MSDTDGALLESVPNFSVGRDRAVLRSLVETMTDVQGVHCLASEADADHNRSVITLAGEPPRLADALVRGAARAIEVIDLRDHGGVHMRMGALDVCPLVPLAGTAMAVAVETARLVAERLAGELDLPVFLYGHAAAQPRRRVLGAIRNYGFERLRELVGRDPEFDPDFGPRVLHESAGAVGVGARGILIAYNINLETDDVRVAADIAKRVRESSGGLPAVQARGFFLEGPCLAQVSMNLLDHAVTPVRAVYDAVAAAAREAGVGVRESELIGLVPEAALDAETAQHVRLRGFDPATQTLEERLRACGLLAR